MRLDVPDLEPETGCELDEAADLAIDRFRDLGGGQVHVLPAEAFAVRIRGVGADADAVTGAELHHADHGFVVAGVAAAGDVGGGDLADQGFVGGRRLADVGIDVDRTGHHILVLTPLPESPMKSQADRGYHVNSLPLVSGIRSITTAPSRKKNAVSPRALPMPYTSESAPMRNGARALKALPTL